MKIGKTKFGFIIVTVLLIFLQVNVKSQNLNKENNDIVTDLSKELYSNRIQGDQYNSAKIQREMGKLSGETVITPQNDPAFHFELNPDPVPFEGDYNVSQINSLNAWSHAVATVPSGFPNANRIWVAATEFKSGGPDTIKFYYSSNGGSAWVYYGKLFTNINGDYRADELDIEIVNSGSDVFIFGVAGHNNLTNNTTEGVFFRISTTNSTLYVARLTNSSLGSNYRLYNYRITSDNTNYTSTTYCLITASCRVDCNGTDGNYEVLYLYADQLFLLPTFHYMPIVTGTNGCPLPFSANYYIYSDVGYTKYLGVDKVYVMFHINAGASYNYTKVTIYNNYTTEFTTTTLSETAESHGQRMAFTGGTSGSGIITYVRKFSGNDWDLACYRTSDGFSWTQSTIDQSTKRARWADVTAVRGTASDFKIGYIQDNPTVPAGFYTGNSGNNWSSPVSLVISNQQIDTIYTRVRAGYTSPTGDNCLAVYANASTFYGYASRLCNTTTGINETGIPEKFALQQNYPNPFNPVTAIKFSIPSGGIVKLEIFDAAGRLIDTPLNNSLEAGDHQYTFDASGYASGVYFYKLTAGKNFETKKMLLVK